MCPKTKQVENPDQRPFQAMKVFVFAAELFFSTFLRKCGETSSSCEKIKEKNQKPLLKQIIVKAIFFHTASDESLGFGQEIFLRPSPRFCEGPI